MWELLLVPTLGHELVKSARPLLRPLSLAFALSLLLNEPTLAGDFDYHTIRRDNTTEKRNILYEGESNYLPIGNARPQGMKRFGPQWSGDSHFLWDGEIGSAAKFRFQAPRDSNYRITIQLTRAVDYGQFQITLNKEVVYERVDLFSTKVELAPRIVLDGVRLAQGDQTLTFKLTGGNENAVPFRKGFLLGLDYVRAEDLSPPPRPPPKAAPSKPTQPISSEKAHDLMRRFCIDCHGGESVNGDVDIASLRSTDSSTGRQTGDLFTDSLETLSSILDAVSFGTMPPEDEAQPSSIERKQLADYLGNVLDNRVESEDAVAPVVMRRLNRYEYNNAVRDLLHLRGDVYPLPERTLRADASYFRPESGRLPEVIRVGNRTLGKNQVERQILDGVSPFAIDLQAEAGFNNRGDQLSISPLLLETFVKLGQNIVFSPEFPGYCDRYDELFGKPHGDDRNAMVVLARERIASLLRSAFRGQTDEPTARRYGDFFEQDYRDGGNFEDSMKRTVAAILASPRFLFLSESKRTANSMQLLRDHELATRLSFFLWSTIPDTELLDLADRGELNEPNVLEAQVQRMLLDPRAQALSENFARQWLRLDQLITAVPDFERFPKYYSRIGCEQWKFGLQMMVEPLLLFDSVVVEDRSIMLLIDSNYSYRSDELESWYRDDVPFAGRKNGNRFNTNQQNFVRRRLGTRRQGGVITTAAVMTMTSSPLRTSPITRGSWVATAILNNPPEPPPDVVPEIEADDDEIEAAGLTLRQRLMQHQADQSCAACHSKIDPLGFALENYDAVGRWRDSYRSGLAIDSAGKLFGEAEFETIEQFKDALLDRPDVFIRAFTEHLLSYALGRELRPTDRPHVDRIVRRARQEHGRFSTVVSEIIKSRPFRHKTNQAPMAESVEAPQ